MAQVDTYLSHLVHSKYQGNIIILEAENKLLYLKVGELEHNNLANRNSLLRFTEETSNGIKVTTELAIRETELRIKNILNTIELNCLIIERFEYLIKSKVSN
jgi:hypothetical protein